MNIDIRKTLADLAHKPGKAELIGGKIVHFMPTGFRPGLVASQIFRNLADHVDTTQHVVTLADSVGYAVPELASGRESFSPDVSYFADPISTAHMGFIQGSPTFAVEVRSENDYGPAAERAIEARRVDYFDAGTQVVWDVDPIADTIRRYRADSPNQPTLFARCDTAEAEPAVPGWLVEVDRIFP